VRASKRHREGIRGKAGRIASALAFTALAVPAAASGEPIYVAPEDESSGFFCSESQPCSIVIGINFVADDGDEILMAPGTYETSVELEVPVGSSNVTIRPRDAGTRPVIDTTATTGLQLTGSPTTVRGIDVSHHSPAGTGIFALASSRIHNVFAVSNGDTPCQMGNGLMTDSICIATSTSGRALRVSLAAGSATPSIRNATLLATGSNGAGIYASASDSDADVSIDVASSIVAGDGFDVETNTGTGGSVDIALAASNFESRAVDTGASVTAPTTAGNQTEEPIFVGFGLEQSPDSPTVDAGLVDDKTGTTDVYGDPRPQGLGNDIGADELPDTIAPTTSITRKPHERTKSRRAKFVFRSNEPGATFECKLDGAGYDECASPLKLKKLKLGRHTFAVRALDSAGNTDATPAKHRWKVKRKR